MEKTWEIIAFTVSMVAHMIMGEVSLKNMSGPLSIADIAGSSADAGLAVFLGFLALVSISLGILNLLPIPMLDGGQIVYQLAEVGQRCAAVGARHGARSSDRNFLRSRSHGLRVLQRHRQVVRFMKILRVVQCAVLCAAGWTSTAAFAAFEPFVVRNFRVEGAQRIAEGTIYNYLPINIGDTVDERRLREAGRALFETGFFQDFEFRRDGDTLVIVVLERPSILEFTFDGNKDIKDEDLEKVLTENGLTTGKTFDHSTLEQLTQSLTEEYYGRGKTRRRSTPTVEPVDDNRVRVSIQIEEGDRAKIRQVNIVGNTSFEEEEIIADFELSTGNWLSFIRNNDRYSKEALEGDLEKLRSFYMDRGFADFRADDVQVAISPDKRDIFVTISVTEGDRYTISDVKLAGEMVVPEADLEGLMLAQPGQTFSQAVLTQSEELMAAARPRRLRVRRDSRRTRAQQGNEASVDHVLRRSAQPCLRAAHQLQRRRQRQRRGLPPRDAAARRRLLVERVWSSARSSRCSSSRMSRTSSTRRRPCRAARISSTSTSTIEEGLPGQFGGSLGYSESYGVTLGGNFIHSNFMGTGRRVALDLRGGEYQKVYDINYTDPYRNIDGVSRTISLTYQDITQYTSATSDFSTTTLSRGNQLGLSRRELQRLTLGFAYQDAELITSQFSSRQALEWVRRTESRSVRPAVRSEPGPEPRPRLRLAVRLAQRRAVSDAPARACRST